MIHTSVMAKYLFTRLYSHKYWSQEGIISIATRLWAGRSRVYIPAGPRDLILLQNSQIVSGAQPASSVSRCVKWPGHETDHIPPPTAEVKKEWNYASTPARCLHGVCRDNYC